MSPVGGEAIQEGGEHSDSEHTVLSEVEGLLQVSLILTKLITMHLYCSMTGKRELDENIDFTLMCMLKIKTA